MEYTRDYHQILDEDCPDIAQLWCNAVGADFESCRLYQEGKIKEAEEMGKLHDELWVEYSFASKLVLTGHEELE